MAPPKKILAIKLRSMGDTVLMTAPILELIKAFPGAELHVVATSPWHEILEGLPGIKKIWPYQRHEDKTARARAIALIGLKLRKEKYDCVVNFHASPSSATLSFATGAKTRANHFHGLKDKNLYSTITIPGKGVVKPVIERDMDTVRSLGLSIPTGKLPKMVLTNEEKQYSANWIEKSGLKAPIAVFGLGSSKPSKSWPMKRFAELASKWVQATHGSVLAIMDAKELPVEQVFFHEVDAAVPPGPFQSAIQTAVSLPLRHLAGILAQSALFVGNDSGPKHMAIAVDTPTVTIFGPEDPFEWHPYSIEQHPYLFIEGLICRRDAQPGFPPWCGIYECILEKHRCMQEIQVQSVFDKCLKIYKK